MPSAFGEAGSTGAMPPLPATAAPESASAQRTTTARDRRTACHSMKVTKALRSGTRVELPASGRAAVRGLRQRGRAARGSRLPRRGGSARLLTGAPPGGQARLLALGIDHVRGRGHVPEERRRRRDLRGSAGGARWRPPCRSSRPERASRREASVASRSRPASVVRQLTRLEPPRPVAVPHAGRVHAALAAEAEHVLGGNHADGRT